MISQNRSAHPISQSQAARRAALERDHRDSGVDGAEDFSS